MEKEKQLQLGNPQDIATFAGTLKKFITENKLSCVIQGKQYVYCDGWKFAGISFGLTAIPQKPVNESTEKETKYSCECDIINLRTNTKIGYGFAVCSKLEAKKKSFDEYAIASMAQTRAIAKAFRNLLGFIMNTAGFEATPAEEAEGITVDPPTESVNFTQEIKEQIDLMTDVDKLFEYATRLTELHEDTEFREYVSAAKKRIIEASQKKK